MSFFSRPSSIWRYLLIGGGGFAAIVLVELAWTVSGPGPTDFAGGKTVALADYHDNVTGVPAELANAAVEVRGEYLARAASCKACHTASGGAAYAGGLAFVLPFGTLYSPNITADKETGIGSWSDAAFLNALHKGVDDQGASLYPAMPYATYTRMTDADALAIKAYLFSLKPVHAAAPENSLSFPVNQRWLMGIWSFLFNADKRFAPNADRSAQWNRGAYLVEALAHCGECHTPRNLLQAQNNRSKFSGAVQAGWRAYNITSDKAAGVGGWSEDQLTQYLSAAHAEGRGTAAGPMGEAIDDGLRYLTHDDIAAVVSYLRTVPAVATPDLPVVKAEPAPSSHKEGVTAELDPRGKAIFQGACASCHDWTGVSPLTPFATLTGARAANDPTGTNVVQIVLNGTQRRTPSGTISMPAFGPSYSDAEIAAVTNYVTARFGSSPSDVTAKDVAHFRNGR